MGRNRKEADRWMPARLYRGKSAYEYRPRSDVCIKVCALTAERALVLRKFAEAYERYHAIAGSFAELAEEYFASRQFAQLAPRTRYDFKTHYWPALKPVFGHVNARKILPEHVRKYMDLKGQTSESTANRHKGFLSAIFAWGFERGKVKENPCKGVRKFTERARDRYIEDHEYKAVHDHAPLAVQVAMEISYLCAARQGDVLALTKAQILEDGIYIRQGKTGKQQIKLWTPRLRQAIEKSRSIETKIASTYVVPSSSGTRYSSSGFKTAFRRARDKAREVTGMSLDFTFHDIKAKAISDYEGNKQDFSGHKTARQVATYDRKTQRISALDVPNIEDRKKQ